MKVRVPGKFERLWAERHERDLELTKQLGGHPKGFRFDVDAGLRAVRFIEAFCRHAKGEWAGKPLKLEEWQRSIVMQMFGWLRPDGTRRFRTCYVEIPRKNGKSTLGGAIGLYLFVADGEPGAEVYSSAPLCIETPVPTPDGWTTMGALKPGDFVFDENGYPTRVASVSPIFECRPCLEVEFHDGERVITDEDHLWSVRSIATESLQGKPKHAWRNTAKRRAAVVRSTREIKDTILAPNGGSNHSVQLGGSLQLPEKNLPIPPYTLGAWLGDGRQNRGCLVFHQDDVEILKHIEREGFETRRHDLNFQPHLYKFTVLGLRTMLRRTGLLELKHVPALYLRASARQRMELLRGLMDTDGTCTKTGECRFTNRNILLAQGTHELLMSLGILPHFREVSVTGKPHYVVSFRTSQRVFNLKRKADRQVAPGPRANQRYIRSVNPVPSRPVRCIEVNSPSHLFLVGKSMIPTHNTKQDQARIVWDAARETVRASKDLRRFVKTMRNTLTCPRLGSKFEPLSADSDTLDGLNVHGNIVDELHAHKNRRVWDILDTAMGARRQPLTLAITTAGTYDPESIGWQMHDYACKVLEGVIEDDTFFAFIAAADDPPKDWPDYYFSEEAQMQANPGYGVSAKAEFLTDQSAKAQKQTSFANEYLRLHLNVWTRSVTRWLSLERWAECEPTLKNQRSGVIEREKLLEGEKCWGGLDLSSKLDLSAFVLAFPRKDGTIELLSRFWLPEATVDRYSKKSLRHYDQWQKEGWLSVTPGDVIDYDFIKNEVEILSRRFAVQDVAFDPWGATDLATRLMNSGVKMVECRQGYKTLSEPSKDLEARVVSRTLKHMGNPILRFCAANAVVTRDSAENIKPDKEKATDRIDGIVATVMALSRVIANREVRSPYESRGLLVLG